MTDRLVRLLEFATEPEVYFVEYLKVRAGDGKGKVVFVLEGKDDPKFYTAKFGAIIKHAWKAMSVGGKQKVIELRESIRKHPRLKDDFVYFFIDRDFDDLVSSDDVYVTPCYSVENLYCTPRAVERLLEAECGLTDYEIENREQILRFLVDKYESIQRSFHSNRRTRLANSVFLYVRKVKNNKRISLDKLVKLSVSVEESLRVSLVKGRYFIEGRESERQEFKDFVKTSQCWDEVSRQPALRFRGKQEILVLRAYLDLLKHDGYLANFTQNNFGRRIKIDNSAMSNHVLSAASQYAETPECLHEFLNGVNEKVCSVQMA
ncbi:DUF4435 domain-containing protein [Pseudomonas berkeleyensis]|uniref:DUF4435 domain-containing protein n=1 Tax=Pseudomonas berkeleyensis TaxID=2726956 RepID=A0A7G5DSC7_9PSED|nr:DUF4435 domain-containing protein [Pseudomonas berkeleyensis]QMV64652.1 DUF4435 domain-containing protein [Pseudomonas berkeleyensis]WSO40120.1 DUF4435 domain-containing protein [Pseudomonas berkeleyensis]